MAGRKEGVCWLVAAAVVAALSGCASVPDAIKGTTPTPQQDLVRDERAAAVCRPGSAFWR